MRDESGSVLVVTLILMVVMLGLGYVAVAQTTVQSHQTGSETAGEAAFNLAESALDAQARLLQLNWPGTTANTTACNQSTAASSTCPGTAVTTNFSSTYAGQEYANPTWTTEFGGVCPTSKTTCTSSGESPYYYSDPIPTASEGCDCYGANAVWVRSQATVQGQTKAVVAEIERETVVEALPDTTVTAGGVDTSNRGNKVIIEQSDTAPTGLTGAMDLTCGSSSTQPSYQSGCAGWDSSKNQASPGTYQAGYTDPNGYSVLSPTQLAALESAATQVPANTCPSSWTGLIYISSLPSGGCTITDNGSGCSKSSAPSSGATPGMIIVGSIPSGSTLTVGANNCYYGVIYAANTTATTPSSGTCTTSSSNAPVTLAANSVVYGALFADNCGLVTVGQASGNTATVYFDSLALSAATAEDTPVLAKNTFRILSGG